MKIKITHNKNKHEFKAEFSELTKGELMALSNALHYYGQASPVAADLDACFKPVFDNSVNKE